MIRKNEELSKLNDEEFGKLFTDFDKEIKEVVSEKILNQFLSYYIKCGFEKNTLSEDNLDFRIKTGMDDLIGYINKNNCNKEIIKKILENDYKLKVVNEDPLEIKVIK